MSEEVCASAMRTMTFYVRRELNGLRLHEVINSLILTGLGM